VVDKFSAHTDSKMLSGVTEDLPNALLADLTVRLLTNVARVCDIGGPMTRAPLDYEVCSRYHEHKKGSRPCTTEQIKASYHILPERTDYTEFKTLAPFEHYSPAKAAKTVP